MAQYKEDFPVGSLVRIKERSFLEAFKKEWRYHTPLKSKQITFAGREGKVAKVFYYHGGDVLYSVENMPNLWHEQCLEAAP